jgi:hypothetical protein
MGVATLRRRPTAGIRPTKLLGWDRLRISGGTGRVRFMHGVRVSPSGAEGVPPSITAVFSRMVSGWPGNGAYRANPLVVAEHFLVELFQHGRDQSAGPRRW